jgi:hypothetical protein
MNRIVILKSSSLKISIVILSLITVLSCSKKTATSQFAGTRAGTYSSRLVEPNPPIFDTGTLKIVVDANNNASGSLQSLQGGSPAIMHGTVDPSSGAISIGTGDEGGNVNVFFGLGGTLSTGTGTGTLGYPWATTSGWWVSRN